MNSFKRFDLLEAVELWAADNGCISSEEELSQRFEEECGEYLAEHADDGPWLRGAFNDWTDGLCKDGELHEEQYNSYCYVGSMFDMD